MNQPNQLYSRTNHFRDNFIQLNNCLDIQTDEESLKIINFEIKQLHKDISEITTSEFKKITQKLKQNKYRNSYLYTKLSMMQNKKLIITKNIQEIIFKMFEQIQIPFDIFYSHSRINFFPFDYVLHKFFELLELNEFLIYVPLSTNKLKYKNWDMIWKYICQYLRWDFHPST